MTRKVTGIRILDEENHIITVKLSHILKMIPYGKSLHWAILFSDVTPNPGEGDFIVSLEEKIKKSSPAYMIDWKSLLVFSEKIYQEIDLIVVGCKDKTLLHHYDDDTEMYNTCDIVIEMNDSSFWQVFSNDSNLIDRIRSSFKKVQPLTPDFKR